MPPLTHPNASPSRTPPDLKWLLNERAALVGQRQRAEQRAAHLATRLARLELLVPRLRRDLANAIGSRDSLDRRVQAFDQTVAIAYPQVSTDAAGVVRPQNGRYGRQGALKDFVRQCLEGFAPNPVGAAELKRLVIREFQLEIRTPDENRTLKESIKAALLSLRDREGVVVAERHGPSLTFWRWRAPADLAALRAMAQAASGVAGRPMTHRTRTPSDAKWLANELAATAGELQRVDRELVRLRARRQQLRRKHASLVRVAELAAFPALQELVRPVQAHPAYGHRGLVKDFLRQTLRNAHPHALDSLTLSEAAARQFESAFGSAEERQHFRRKLVLRCLQKLAAAGEVERLHAPKGSTVGCWRWYVPGATLDELRTRTQEVAPWP